MNKLEIIFENGVLTINDIEIEENIFEGELTTFQPVNKSEHIEIYIEQISETVINSEEEKGFQERIDILNNTEEEYLFYDELDEEYVSKSSDPQKFKEMCYSLLEIQKTL